MSEKEEETYCEEDLKDEEFEIQDSKFITKNPNAPAAVLKGFIATVENIKRENISKLSYGSIILLGANALLKDILTVTGGEEEEEEEDE